MGVVLDRERAGELAVGDDEHAVGGLEHLQHLGAEHDHRIARMGEFAQQAIDLPLALDIDAAGRLLQQEQARLAHQRLGDGDLLLIAAGERADALEDRPGLHQEAAGRRLGQLPHMPLAQGHAGAGDLRLAETDQKILADGEIRIEAPLPGGRDIGRVAPDRRAILLPDAVDRRRPAAALDAREGAQELAGARSLHPHEGQDLALLDGKSEALELAVVMGPAGGAEQPAPGRRRGLAGAAFRDRLAPFAEDELLGDGVLAEGLAHQIRGHAAVADDGHALGMFHQIAQAMAHQDHDAPRRGQAAHLAEELVGFLIGQSGIRLVEEEDAGISRQGPGDLGALLGGQGAAAQGPLGQMEDAEGVHQLAVMAPEARPEQAAALAPDHQILGHAQIGKELGLLMHHRDGRRRIGEAPAAAGEAELPRIGGLFAGEDAHQRALAGAIRSGDPQHLSRAQLEIEPVEGLGIAVALAQAPDLDGAGALARHSPRTHGAFVHAALLARSLVRPRSRATAPMVTNPRKSCWA